MLCLVVKRRILAFWSDTKSSAMGFEDTVQKAPLQSIECSGKAKDGKEKNNAFLQQRLKRDKIMRCSNVEAEVKLFTAFYENYSARSRVDKCV